MQIDSITVVVVRAGHAILAQISVRPYVNICVFHFALNWYSFPLSARWQQRGWITVLRHHESIRRESSSIHKHKTIVSSKIHVW